MKSKILFLLAGVSILAAFSKASANTESFQDTQEVTRFGSVFTFQQFNPSLGTLTAIDLIINSSVPGGDFSVQRFATGNASISGTVTSFTQRISIEDDNGSLFSGPTQNLSFSGINSIPRSVTRVLTINPSQSLIATTPSNPISVNPASWSLYTGVGIVSLSASTTPEAIFTTGLGITANYDNLISPTTLTLRYSYSNTTPIPEPGQVAASLLLLGGIGAYMLIKRRKKTATTAA